MSDRYSLFSLRKSHLHSWLLNHPCRASWIAAELLRLLPLRTRLGNAWWQFRHFNDHEAFDALWQTWRRSTAHQAEPGKDA